ncbi:MAG: TolC family protein, partial [Acidobacteria bacterium]|nr:TolC family protein [Acidobacteriota bacterium]
EACLEKNPELQAAAAAIDARRAQLEMERAESRPDWTVSAGYRHLRLEGASTWTAGISIPLPFSDRRQGAIAEVRSLLARSQSEKAVLERRLRAALQQARHDHGLAAATADTLYRLALPAAREAAAALEEGYRLGKFDYLQVLDAARTYAEYQSQYIESVAAGMKAALEIERLASCTQAGAPPGPGASRGESNHEK